MSYAEAKEIALLRQELRACWERLRASPGRSTDQTARRALARMTQVAGADDDLRAEVRRWSLRFA